MNNYSKYAKQLANVNLSANTMDLICMFVINKSLKEYLLIKTTESEEKKIASVVNEVCLLKKPVQYITQLECFYNRYFYVDERVLIPRFESEIVVYNTLKQLKTTSNLKILDLCCGSGCLGITLIKELNNSSNMLTSVDISKGALEVTKINAKKNDCKINLIESDFLEKILEKKFTYDVIICNPPYIDKSEKIEKLVYDNEPHLALFAKKNGLFFYEILIENLLKITKKEFLCSLEIGCMQAEEIVNIIGNKFNYKVMSDLQKRDRNILIWSK